MSSSSSSGSSSSSSLSLQNLEEYLCRTSLLTPQIQPLLQTHISNTFVKDAFSATKEIFSEEEAVQLLTYKVPKLGPEGTCS